MRNIDQEFRREVLEVDHRQINLLRELISEFDGKKISFERFPISQINFIINFYELKENSANILNCSKLCGKAFEWFYSRPEHIEMNFQELLEAMKNMFDVRQTKTEKRREFERRTWMKIETFCDYFHSKVILANSVLLENEEMVDYIIDGISDKNLQHQARIQCFPTKERLVEAFKNISLESEKIELRRKL